jgi:hypothetical protein
VWPLLLGALLARGPRSPSRLLLVRGVPLGVLYVGSVGGLVGSGYGSLVRHEGGAHGSHPGARGDEPARSARAPLAPRGAAGFPTSPKPRRSSSHSPLRRSRASLRSHRRRMGCGERATSARAGGGPSGRSGPRFARRPSPTSSSMPRGLPTLGPDRSVLAYSWFELQPQRGGALPPRHEPRSASPAGSAPDGDATPRSRSSPFAVFRLPAHERERGDLAVRPDPVCSENALGNAEAHAASDRSPGWRFGARPRRMARSGRPPRRDRAPLPLPVIPAAVGGVGAAHALTHAVSSSKSDYLIQVTHTAMGRARRARGRRRWLELRTAFRPRAGRRRRLGDGPAWLTRSCFLFYREANVVVPKRVTTSATRHLYSSARHSLFGCPKSRSR